MFTAMEHQHVSPFLMPRGSEEKHQKANQTHLSGPGLASIGLVEITNSNVFYFQMLRTSNSPWIKNQCVMLKYNLLTPDHSVPRTQLVQTKQHDMPFICHFLNPTLHRGIRVSQGKQSSCIPAFSHTEISAKRTATFL